MSERSQVALLFAGFWLLYGLLEHNMTRAFWLIGLVFLVWIFFEIKEVSDARMNIDSENEPNSAEMEALDKETKLTIVEYPRPTSERLNQYLTNLQAAELNEKKLFDRYKSLSNEIYASEENFGSDLIELFKRIAKEGTSIDNAFLLKENLSDFITDDDINTFGGNIIELMRKATEHVKIQFGNPSPSNNFFIPLSEDDINTFSEELVELAIKIACSEIFYEIYKAQRYKELIILNINEEGIEFALEKLSHFYCK